MLSKIEHLDLDKYNFNFLTKNSSFSKNLECLNDGHFYSESNNDIIYGPIEGKRCKLMIVGMYPGKEEKDNMKNFCGPSGTLFINMCKEILSNDFDNCFSSVYLTNFIKYYPGKTKTNLNINKEEKEFWKIVLANEIRKVRPENVLLLGDLSLKVALGNNEKLKDFYGQYKKVDFPWLDYPVTFFALSNPASLFHHPNLYNYYKKGLSFVLKRAFFVVNDEEIYSKILVVDTEFLSKLVDQILTSSNKIEKIALDMEWYGGFPSIKGIQEGTKKLISIQLYTPTLDKCIFYKVPNNTEWVEPIKRLLLNEKIKIIGHFLQTDSVWLSAFGINLYDKLNIDYDQINKISKKEDLDSLGIFEISLAAHALNENDSLDLCNIAVKELGIQRWDSDINLENILSIEEEKLKLYACKDVFYTYKISEILKNNLIQQSSTVTNPLKPFLTSLAAFPAFIKMMCNGVYCDQNKFSEYLSQYEKILIEKENEIKRIANFDEFNVRSHEQCAVILFGKHAIVNKKDNKKIVSDDANIQKLNVILRTENGNASTNKLVLAYLKDKNELCKKLYEYRTLYKARDIIKQLKSYIDEDGKIITFLTQTKETGRTSSSNPNLQNLPNAVEHYYKEIMADSYPGKIRALFKPSSPKYTFLSADLGGAEILVGAVSSRDDTMIEDYYKSQLPEDDPLHLDIPSKIVVDSLFLTCRPTKKELKKLGYEHLRNLAKRVIYGLSYGASANKIYETAKLEGLQISMGDVNRIISTFKDRYKSRFSFNYELYDFALKNGYLINCFGRIRRFNKLNIDITVDEKNKTFYGEALNFIPQSTVADTLNVILNKLHRDDYLKDKIKIILQIHDEILLEIDKNYIEEIENRVKKIMSSVYIFPTDLNGRRIANTGYNFIVNTSVNEVWDKD